MQCVILAGGLGTRMKAVSGDLPKALLPVGRQTFIDWQLQWLKRRGATQALLALGHEGASIEEHLEKARIENDLYPELKYRYDGKELLGTGGALLKLAPELENDFVVTYGDSFLFIDVARLFEAHRTSGLGVTFSIFKNDGKGDASNVVYRDGSIVVYDKFNRTPEMDHIDYGMMVFNKTYFLAHAPQGRFDLAPLLTDSAKQRQMQAFLASEPFREIGSPEGYAGFRKLLENHGFDLNRLDALVSSPSR